MELYLGIGGIFIVALVWIKRSTTAAYPSYARHITSEFKHLSTYVNHFDLLRDILETWNKDIIEFSKDLIVWEDANYPELIFSCTHCSILHSEESCIQLHTYGLDTPRLGKNKHLSLDGFSYTVTIKDGQITQNSYRTKRKLNNSEQLTNEKSMIQTTDSINLGKEFSHYETIICTDDEVK